MKVGDKVRVSNDTRMLPSAFGTNSTPPSNYCGYTGTIISLVPENSNFDWEVEFDESYLSPDVFQERELELL